MLNTTFPKKVFFVFGTRPEAIKMAMIIKTLQKDGHFKVIIVVTAQHRQMLDQVLRIFKIRPDYDLKVMVEKQTLAGLTGKVMQRFNNVIKKEKPDLVIVQGDTTTTFASALVSFYHKIAVAHVEAGLRTYDKYHPFPEEINRRLTSSLADIHFAPTLEAYKNLLQMTVREDKIFITGNTVIDSLLEMAKQEQSFAWPKWNKAKRLLLVTVHRRESFGEPLKNICGAISVLARKYFAALDIIIPVHKNPNVRKIVYAHLGKRKNIILTEPLEYDKFVYVMKHAYFILTDSGGIQEEAPALGKPVLVLREVTERPEGVQAGTVKVVGTDKENILKEAEKLLVNRNFYQKMSRAVNPYGDGLAAKRIKEALLYYFGFSKKRPRNFYAGVLSSRAKSTFGGRNEG